MGSLHNNNCYTQNQKLPFIYIYIPCHLQQGNVKATVHVAVSTTHCSFQKYMKQMQSQSLDNMKTQHTFILCKPHISGGRISIHAQSLFYCLRFFFNNFYYEYFFFHCFLCYKWPPFLCFLSSFNPPYRQMGTLYNLHTTTYRLCSHSAMFVIIDIMLSKELC